MISLVALAALVGLAHAADSAADRREALAQVRERMGDPDPLMRLAYLEQLGTSQDQTAILLALRYALASDDADLRALALRLYMGNAKSLDLKVIPTQELRQLATDPQASKDLNKRLLTLLATGYLRFRVADFDFKDASFKVYAMDGVNAPNEKYAGPGQVRGVSVSFSVKVYGLHGQPRCTVSLQPTADLELTGEAACETGLQHPTVPVAMPML
jgi:hypothetical protein